jgi:hypothetical protein
MVFGPGTLSNIRIYVTGEEAERQRNIREFPGGRRLNVRLAS